MHHHHPALALRLLPLAASLLLHLHLRLHLAVAATDATGGGPTCLPATCGSLNISYPFSLAGEQPMHCGYPAFELTCAGGRAYLNRTLREHMLRVHEIFYGNASLVMSVEAIFAGNSSCRFPDFNVSSSLALVPANISDTNESLVFVYDCAPLPRHIDFRWNMSCGSRQMGAFIDDDHGRRGASNTTEALGNCTFLRVPVRPDRAKQKNWTELIGDGFLVKWETLGDCHACNLDGGECRFNEGSFLCFCPEGSPCPNSNSTTPRNSSNPSAPRGNKMSGWRMILIVLTAAAASLLFPCIYVLIWHRKGEKIRYLLCTKTSSANEANIEAIIESYGSLAPKRYKYSEVTKITNYLDTKLGEGGYGVVFKGRLHDDRVVAVKFLHDSKGKGEEFVNEVMSIGRTSHVNVVSLFGFCLEGSKRALIYEYMPNGSLDKYIYSESPKEILQWDKLYTIAIGIARGLEYLHYSCNTRIIHFDIKPQNILLDQDFCPKIADFGLAKLCRTKESKLSMTGARGTIGFIAPEVHSRTFGVVSTKSDIFSYGMMLLEMVGGRKNVKSIAERSSEKYFPDWIYDHFALDEGLQACEVTPETEEIARKMTLIGLWCIQVLPVHRPTVTKVLEMFEKSLHELDMPPKQNFSQLLEDSHHKINIASASSTSPVKAQQILSEMLQVKETSLVNSKILKRLPTL